MKSKVLLFSMTQTSLRYSKHVVFLSKLVSYLVAVIWAVSHDDAVILKVKLLKKMSWNKVTLTGCSGWAHAKPTKNKKIEEEEEKRNSVN